MLHKIPKSYVALCLAVAIAGLAMMMPNRGYADTADLWRSLNTPGHFVLIRHALAPGTGDPVEFDIDDCATQRNLSQTGRAQARTIGTLFRQNGIDAARVFTSQWCRCQDTARLLELGDVTALPALNSFFGRPGNRQPQTDATLEWMHNDAPSGPVVLVTHQVNISALTSTYASSGELVFIQLDQGEVKVLGTISTG